MLKRFLPGQGNFFELFQKTADILVEASQQFYEMLHDLGEANLHVQAIAAFEEKGDCIAHETFELLHKTFITPFDRHDIHQLISGLDDILDLLNRSAQRFSYYELKDIPPEMSQLATIAKESCDLLKRAIYELHSLKQSPAILSYCEAIDEKESVAHQIVILGEKKLFATETDFKHFFKLKEIYAQIKSVINSCHDAGNIIKGIILEYS